MRNPFFNNRNTQKLLAIFTHQPLRFFSTKELAVRTGVSEGKIKIIVASLSRSRILSMAEKKRCRYYQVNRHSAIFSELTKLFKDSKISGRDLIERVVSSCGEIKFAALAGIFTGHIKAPADLLIVGRAGEKRLKHCIDFLQKLAGNEINFAVITESDFKERLYSFDWFLKEILENDPVILIDKMNRGKRLLPTKKHVAAIFSNFKNDFI